MIQELKNKVICADSIDIMRKFPDKSIDLCLCDPPYGIGIDKELNKKQGKYGYSNFGETNWDNERPSKEYFNEIFRISKNQIIWGGNYFTDYLYPSMGWLVWDKGQRNFSLADGELAWTSFNKALRIKTVHRSQALNDIKQHPTQKSLGIIMWCIQYADRNSKNEIKIILDPFLGSGTTAVACQNLKRNFIGIEISEEYCKIARDRLRQQPLL